MPSKRAYHSPVSDPCTCGIPVSMHVVEHQAKLAKDTLLCELCGLPAQNHRSRKGRQRYNAPPSAADIEIPITYIGIDGEGQENVEPGSEHRYVMLAASTESGDGEWVINAKTNSRLSTVECLDLILELPTKHTKVFSFSFNYDITKMLTDLPDEKLYKLARPNLRARKGKAAARGPIPVEWKGYKLNLQGTKFTVERAGKKVVIWDLFKFFQSKFVGAIRDWKVGNEEIWKRMSKMKDKRSSFIYEKTEDIQRYCLEETRCIAELARKLVEAHVSADLKLKSFYGAGSSGGAMLTAMGIKEKLAACPDAMAEAVASAFFGGRFEHSVIGAIHEPLQSWDISSAYVYQLAFLPCLQHCTWTHTTKRSDIEKAECQNGALIRYSLPSPGARVSSSASWGPFPFRTSDGSISFPIESGGGWVWLDEFLAAERSFSHVRFHEAWVYGSNCDCKPFSKIPEYYLLRLKIGKEGPGIVIKLGMNSCFGKLAQSVGSAIFNCWIWAGMITSGCRAQLLQMYALHKNPANLLMMATDGIITREHLTPPVPLFTGTNVPMPVEQKDGSIKMIPKPLGGWEHKQADNGMFLARPGIYFPMNPTIDEIKQVRARGVGRSVVLEYWKLIQDTWQNEGIDGIAEVSNVRRFCGLKTSISRSGTKDNYVYKRANGKGDSPSYGQWVLRKVKLGFDPMPKRASLNPDGLTLSLRKFSQSLQSVPYKRALKKEDLIMSADTVDLMLAVEELLEQPDGDYTMLV